MYFRYFVIISPGKKVGALHLNKLESSSPKDTLCQVWLKLAQWFWRRRFFNFVNVFSLFRNYLPLGKDLDFHLNKFETPNLINIRSGPIKGSDFNQIVETPYIVSSLVEIGPVESGGKSSSGEDFLISLMYFCYFVIIFPSLMKL